MNHEQPDDVSAALAILGHDLNRAGQFLVGDCGLDYRMISEAVEPPFYERLPLGRAPLVKHPKLDKSGLASVPPGTYPLTDFTLDVPAAKLRPRRGLEPVQSVGSSDDRQSLLGYEAIPDAALAAAVNVPRLLG